MGSCGDLKHFKDGNVGDVRIRQLIRAVALELARRPPSGHAAV